MSTDTVSTATDTLASLMAAKATWLDELFYFHGVEATSAAALFGVIVLYFLFDFTTIFDLTKWDATEVYVLLGPLIGIAFQVLLVDSTTALVETDYGVYDIYIYWGAMITNIAIQLIANGSSAAVIAIGTFALVVLISLVVILMIVTLGFAAIPIIFGFITLIVIGLMAPIALDVVGLSLVVAFDFLMVTMGYDMLNLLITNPNQIGHDVDLLIHGQLTPYLQNIEDQFEEHLKGFFVMWFGESIMADLQEDFWWIIGAQAIVAVLAVPWVFVKIALGFLIFMSLLMAAGYYDSDDYLTVILASIWYIVGGGILVKMLIFDGPLAALGQSYINNLVFSGFNYGLSTVGIEDLYIDLTIPTWIIEIYESAVVELEGDFWIVYLAWKYIQRSKVDTGITVPSQDNKKIWEMSFGDILSWLTPDDFETDAFAKVKQTSQPLIVMIVLPIIMGLSWSFEIPFMIEMKEHVLSFRTEQ